MDRVGRILLYRRMLKTFETVIRQLNNSVTLESFAVEAAVCNSHANFEKGIEMNYCPLTAKIFIPL
jgi:hypothetical protein